MIKIKEIKLVFKFKELFNESMNDTYRHFIRRDEKKYNCDWEDSIKSNSEIDKDILDTLIHSSFKFKIKDISYSEEDNEIRDLTLELKEE